MEGTARQAAPVDYKVYADQEDWNHLETAEG